MLQKQRSPGISKKVSCEFITAELRDNRVTLTFRNEGLAGLFTNSSTIRYDHPYPVEGLYGEYTDIGLGFLGNGGYAYLLLADTNGQITFCNIMNGMNCGYRFIANGPLPQLLGITSFAVESDEGGSSLLAVSDSGRATDLYDLITQAEICLPYPLQDTTWQTHDGTYALHFTGEAPLVTYSGGGGVLGTGLSLQYLGLTQTGMHYYCPLLLEEGDLVTLMVSLEPLTPLSGSGEGYVITLTQIFGPDLSGLRDGTLQLFPAAG